MVGIAPVEVVVAVATAKIIVMALFDHSVEPCHRRLQRVDRHIQRLCKRTQRIAARNPVRRFALVAITGADQLRIEEAPFVVEGLVEQAPSRQVAIAARLLVDFVEGRSEGIVIGRFVAEALARPVDHDRARQGALAGEQHHAHRVERRLDHRHPPCLAHIAEHRAGLHRHLLAVAGVGADRQSCL